MTVSSVQLFWWLHMNHRVILLAVILTVSATATVSAATREISITGSQEGFVATGITLDGKKKVKLKASGLINYCSGGSQCDATPDGSVSGESHCQSGTNAPFALCGALIARIGGGTPIVIGTGVTLPKSSKGALEIGIQDFKFDDNSGSFKVVITNAPKEKFTLAGNVLTSDGLPFSGEQIIVSSGRKRFGATTDAGGFYQLELEEGKYVVTPKRQGSVPPTLIPLRGSDRALLAPLRIRLNLQDDAFGQNFTSVRFSTLTAPFRKVKTSPNGFCSLSDAPADGTSVQLMNVPLGTALRYADSVLLNVPVKVTARGPYEDVKRKREGISDDCRGVLYDAAGLGVSEQLLANGGSATVELLPR